MRKLTKTIIGLLMALTMLFTGIVASASETSVTPRLGNTTNYATYFEVVGDYGIVETTYSGESTFARADVHVKLEKRFLLAFWNDVGEWSASSTNRNDTLSHAFALDGSGRYRATITLTVIGNDGSVDSVEEVIKCDL